MDDSIDQKIADYRAVQIAFITIPTVAVILRFVARYSSGGDNKGMFWWDDWVILAALPFAIASNAGNIAMTNLGLGQHVKEIPPANLGPFFKLLYATEFTFNVATGVAKSSALFFYQRIFTTKNSPGFKWALWTTQIINGLWLIGSCLGIAFSCDPVQKAWDPLLPGECMTISNWYGSNLPAAVIDLVILLLPMKRIWSLHMDTGRRITLILTFILGYTVPIVSIGRLITLIKNAQNLEEDITYYALPVFYWYNVESLIIIFSGCLVVLASFTRRFWRTKALPYVNSYSSQSSGSKFKLTGSKKSGSSGNGSGSNRNAGQQTGGATQDITPYTSNSRRDFDVESGKHVDSLKEHEDGPMRTVPITNNYV